MRNHAGSTWDMWEEPSCSWMWVKLQGCPEQKGLWLIIWWRKKKTFWGGSASVCCECDKSNKSFSECSIWSSLNRKTGLSCCPTGNVRSLTHTQDEDIQISRKGCFLGTPFDFAWQFSTSKLKYRLNLQWENLKSFTQKLWTLFSIFQPKQTMPSQWHWILTQPVLKSLTLYPGSYYLAPHWGPSHRGTATRENASLNVLHCPGA